MKKLVLMILVFAMVIIMTGCTNRQLIDTAYNFDRAQILLPDGTIVEGAVDGWRDFEDGDQIQIKINGVTYLTHISNAVLIKD